MADDPLAQLNRSQRTAERRERQLERLGGPGTRCRICGIDDLRCLQKREGHHIAGRTNSDACESPICFNCHAKESDGQQDWPGDLLSDRPKTASERQAAMMLGIASLLGSLQDQLRRVAEELLANHRGEDDVPTP